MKKLLIILGIQVLLVIGVLFVPPIYNRFTKPFFKNTVDANEWYHKVDCENLTQVRDYCDRRGIFIKNRIPAMPFKRSLGEHVMGSW